MYAQIFANHKNHFQVPLPGTQKWLSRLHQIIDRNPVNPELNNQKLAQKLEVSERDLFRKVKKITGLSPQKYLRRYRLHKAMQFLENGKFRTVKETGYAVGYSNVSYFITQFEKEFGKKPFQVLKENGWR